MSQFTAADVKNLRETTGAGMMDCKKALEEANGDFEAAIEYLRKKGQKVSAKRADREAKEGVVIALANEANDKGIIIRLSCETDFVAKNEDFVKFAQELAQHAISTFHADKDSLLASLMGEQSVADAVTEQVGKINEKIELSAYATIEAPLVASYIHTGYRAGVLVGLNIANADFMEAGRDVAMQVAAMKPLALGKDDMDASIVEKEIEIGKEVARQEGKPEAMLEKIALGKLNKFYQENTLLSQSFVKGDGKESVADFLKSINKDLTVTAFRHIQLG